MTNMLLDTSSNNIAFKENPDMKIKRYICKLLLIQHKMALNLDYKIIEVRGVSLVHPLDPTLEEKCKCMFNMRKFQVMARCRNAQWNPIMKRCIYAMKY